MLFLRNVKNAESEAEASSSLLFFWGSLQLLFKYYFSLVQFFSEVQLSVCGIRLSTYHQGDNRDIYFNGTSGFRNVVVLDTIYSPKTGDYRNGLVAWVMMLSCVRTSRPSTEKDCVWNVGHSEDSISSNGKPAG